MKAPYISPVQTKEFPYDGSLEEQIRFCCQYGALAPSVHNLQPWSLSLSDATLTVSIYEGVGTKDSDATGRQTWISLGCFVENTIQAAQAAGMQARIISEDYAKKSVKITFNPGKQVKINQSILDSMVSRLSNRNHFQPAVLTDRQRQTLVDAQQDITGAQLIIKDDKKTIELMTELTKQAVALALSMPRLKKELGKTFRSNISRHKTGIPGYALGYGLMRSVIESFRFTHLSVAVKESSKESERMRASAGFVFIATEGDVAKYWFRAGRLYERAALLLASFGLSQSTNAATIEAPDFHQEIEAQISTTNRLQAVIRYGKSDKKVAPSPRLSVEQLFTSTASRD